jgi:ribosome biogenesis GTPase A
MEKLIQWYPGHIAKAQRQLREKIGLVDCVIELVDARMPVSSHFEFVDEIAGHKQRIVVVNKTDLAPPELTKKALAYWQDKGFPSLALEVPSRKGIPELKASLDAFHRELSAKMKKRGRLPRKLRTMVMGLPNVGKSSLINALINKRSMQVSDKPGVTRSLRWIGIGKNLELLDTPGVIPPRFEDQNLALKLALIGSISEYAADPAQVADAGLNLIREQFPGMLARLYGSEQFSLELLCQQRGFLQHGGENDLQRAAESFLQDIRHARQGRFAFELAFDQVEEPETPEETDLTPDELDAEENFEPTIAPKLDDQPTEGLAPATSPAAEASDLASDADSDTDSDTESPDSETLTNAD